MRKRTGIILITFVVLILVSVGIFFYEPIRQTVLSSGFTVTSISTTSVISESTNLKGVFFLINTIANGGGQSVVGTITPTQTKQLSGYETRYPLELSISAIDETVDINIQNLAKPVYRYSYVETNSFSCPSGTDYNILVNIFTQKRICVSKVQDSIQGRLSDASVKFQADVSMEVNGQKYTKRISSDQSAVNFYDSEASQTGLRASAQWTGSLVTGDQLPNYADIIPMYFSNNKVWHLVRESTKDELDNRFSQTETKLSQWESTGWSGIDEIKSTINNFNLYYDNEVKTENVQIQSSTLVNQNDLNNGKVRFSLDRRILSPNILFKARADWIGVKIPVGVPRILSISSPEFNNGERGVIKVKVLNQGTGKGTFAVDISNCEPFDNRYSAETNKFTLDPLKDTTFPVELSTGEVNQDLKSTCTVTVYDVNDPSNQDTGTVQVSMKQAVSCVEGRQWIEGNCIKECRNNQVNTVQCCNFGITLDENNNYVCKAQGDTGEDTGSVCEPLIDNILFKIDNPFCGFKERLGLISILTAFIVSLVMFGVGFTRYAVSGRKKKKIDPIWTTIVALVSISAGVIVWLIIQSFFDFIFSFWGLVTIIIGLIVLFIALRIMSFLR